ncbi:aminotransferase class V-fold PLP-dependent enzyme [Streptomyces sp. XD-27]|uniref:aminotransferase class V-fold PLP-dependent enzyme n=1 Tax=Streptomyces sp. XD-27 TaxID=3062779 RepID=UPI0026F440A6|nr:aminotransferase class V-fold PLP-dependent enzyme [Streptomyces sp. XD-27]WKX69691.1 aminotransferase class V-fold PLP-dependent enzyme [Streptomyces sp. XD-27]
MESLAGAEFTPKTTYLNTASAGLLPARAVALMKDTLDAAASGGGYVDAAFASVEQARATYAGLVDLPVRRVAAGASVAVYAGLIAAALPSGAEVLVAEGDFASLVNPFAVRGDLRLRSVPLAELAEAVRPETALVAVSAVQSADGRLADLDAIAAAARAHGARTLVDTSQSAGWLPLRADAYDFTVCVAYKWLLCPRGVAFMTVPDDLGELTPIFGGWVAGEKPWDSCYGPVTELAHSARRFDEAPALLSYVAADHSLELVAELGPETIGAHDRALADRFRAGLADLGHTPVAAPGSAIVAVPGLGHAAERLAEAEVHVSARAGNLRAAFHLYNTAADVDHLLEVLAGLPG